jgi:tripartite-type tricarboxylate transporter receptor subunit TctC
MNIIKKLKLFIGILILPLMISSNSYAFPDKGLTLIVAYGAGGGTDVTARLLAKDLEATIGHPVTVKNVTGGGGWNGWGTIAASSPDGYTIGYINVPNMYAGYLDKTIGRTENLDSFTLLMNHVTDYCVWAVRKDSPYQSVKDVIDAAKKNPGTISITAHGNGNDDHLAILRMQDITGAEFKVVMNKSTADSKTQVLGGFVDVLGANVSEVAGQVKSGELRLLGVMSEKENKFLPGGKTFKQQGFDQVWAVSRGIAAPAGLPADVQKSLLAALEKTLNSNAHAEALLGSSLAPEVVQGNEYKTLLKNTEQDIKKLMGW